MNRLLRLIGNDGGVGCTMHSPQARFGPFVRLLFYQNEWPKRFDYAVGLNLEKHWQSRLDDSHQRYVDRSVKEQIKQETQQQKQIQHENKGKKYILSMFPYPSGRLHLGHVRVYTLGDVLARYYRMKGYQVIHPIGWDSFGLPAENAAIERNLRPDVWTKSNIEYMKKQLNELALSFDWNRELSTCDKSYYKWTQHLFLQMYLKGIVCRKESLVNWDPVDKTVLANEQIDENGKSWRSGSKVEKKLLNQWFIRSSVYAKSLLDSMDLLDSQNWDIVKRIQKTWIGECDGCFVDFAVQIENEQQHHHESSTSSCISVYTDTPYAVHGVSHIAISRHHTLLKNKQTSFVESKSGRLSCHAVHPLSKQLVPMFVVDDDAHFGELGVDGLPQVQAVLGVPSLSESDRTFAQRNALPFNEIFSKSDATTLTTPNELNGLTRTEVSESVRQKLIKLDKGGHLTSKSLNDWCLSRQRYWGTPIPLVYCTKCQTVPVPFEQLPVELPPIEEVTDERGIISLKHGAWKHTKCPKCDGPAVRETDTMDTFMDSSWYYLRYLDSANECAAFSPATAAHQMPVDVYIGGIEHAMTHLFVSRLVMHFLHDEGLVACREPFRQFIAMGMVKGETYRTRQTGRYVPAERVAVANAAADPGQLVDAETQEACEKSFEKMSKSKLNGIDPQHMIGRYGVDFTRLFLLNFVHPKSDRNFVLEDGMVNGTLNLLDSVWEMVGAVAAHFDEQNQLATTPVAPADSELYRTRNSQLNMITFNLEHNFNMPSYLVAVNKIVKVLRRCPPKQFTTAHCELLAETLVLYAPVVPHFANECWERVKRHLPLPVGTALEKEKLIHEQAWPEIDAKWPVELQFVINYKRVSSCTVPHAALSTLSVDKAISLFSADEKFARNVHLPLDAYTKRLDMTTQHKILRFTLNSQQRPTSSSS